MDDTRTILIVSDDDLLPLEIKSALGEILAAKRIGGGEERDGVPLRYEVLRLNGPWDLQLSDDGYDCCILALRELAATISEAAMEALLRRTRSLLLLTERGVQLERRLAAGMPTVTLVRPCTDAELRASIGRLLTASRPRRDADAIDLLRRLLAERTEDLRPSVLPGEADVRFLDVERHLGPEVDARALLEQLADAGALVRKVGARLRLCRSCGDHQLLYEERCGECGGLDYAVESMLHHFACGFVGREASFKSGEDERRCPKCIAPLIGIGRDHERIGDQLACSCGATAPEPAVMARCLCCGEVQHPGETRERTVSSYHVTERAEAVALEGQRLGDAVQLRDRRSGLYHRVVLVLEVDREHARCTRSGDPYTVLALSVHNLDELRERHGVVSLDYLDALLGRCAGSLRRQDLAARWSPDTAVILLPETGPEGANVVLDRMAANIEAQCAEWLEPLPQIGLAAVTSDGESHSDGAAVVHEALAQARREDSASFVETADAGYVILE